MTSKPNGVRVSLELLSAVHSDLENWLSQNLCECEGGHSCGRSDVESRRNELRALLAQPADQQVEPVRLTAVAVLRDDGDGGLQPDWLLEGGTAELWDGAVLIVADEHPELCEEDGNAELYRHAQPATAKVGEDEEFEKAYQSVVDNGWINVKQMARQVWQARAKLNGGES